MRRNIKRAEKVNEADCVTRNNETQRHQYCYLNKNTRAENKTTSTTFTANFPIFAWINAFITKIASP